MVDTTFDAPAASRGNYAWGYRLDGDVWSRERIEPDGEVGAMGGLATTVPDYARYVSFLLDAWPARDDPETGPVRRSSIREMVLWHAPPFVADPLPDARASQPSAYGYGLTHSSDALLGMRIHHAGGLPGYGSHKIDAELAIASYKWLVADGMVLDPVRHRLILEYLNYGYAPFRYRDLERLASFQNRVLEKFAKAHHDDFFDVARLMPSDPDLFVDAIHGTPEGERLRAWIVLQFLVPVIDRHLADGSWPKKSFPPAAPPAPYTPRVVTFDCQKKAG
ncbi:hypothetical protein OSTOST_10940 [Ostertagia ostertagi]